MVYSKKTMWIDNDPDASKDPMTSAEVKELYIGEFESYCERDVNELWDKVVMSDETASRHDIELLQHWLKNTTLSPIE